MSPNLPTLSCLATHRPPLAGAELEKYRKEIDGSELIEKLRARSELNREKNEAETAIKTFEVVVECLFVVVARSPRTLHARLHTRACAHPRPYPAGSGPDLWSTNPK